MLPTHHAFIQIDRFPESSGLVGLGHPHERCGLQNADGMMVVNDLDLPYQSF